MLEVGQDESMVSLHLRAAEVFDVTAADFVLCDERGQIDTSRGSTVTAEGAGLSQETELFMKPGPGVEARWDLAHTYRVHDGYRSLLENSCAALVLDVQKISLLAEVCGQSRISGPLFAKCLVLCAQRGHVEALRVILRWTAADGEALAEACLCALPGSVVCLKALLESLEELQVGPRGRILNSQGGQSGLTPLMVAAVNGQAEKVAMLLAAGADPKIIKFARTAEMMAAQRRHVEVLKEFPSGSHNNNACLLRAIEGPTPRDTEAGDTLLCVSYLLDRMSSDDARREAARTPRNDQRTPFMLASEQNELEVAQMLLALGSDVNWKDNRGCTALANACRHNADAACIKFLLDNGADPNIVDEDGCAPLAHFCRIGTDQDVVRRLLAAGAEVEAVNEEGLTPLLIATQSGATGLCHVLLDVGGANIEVQDSSGNTPLLTSAYKGCLSTARLFVSKGAYVHCENKYGTTVRGASERARGDNGELVAFLNEELLREEELD